MHEFTDAICGIACGGSMDRKCCICSHRDRSPLLLRYGFSVMCAIVDLQLLCTFFVLVLHCYLRLFICTTTTVVALFVGGQVHVRTNTANGT